MHEIIGGPQRTEVLFRIEKYSLDQVNQMAGRRVRPPAGNNKVKTPDMHYRDEWYVLGIMPADGAILRGLL